MSAETEFLASYDPSKFPPVGVTVDLVVLTIRHNELSVLLVRRGNHPFKGHWALPGGFVEPDETLDDAAVRELLEETGVKVFKGHVEQLRTYGDPGRDPRMRIVSVAYVAFTTDPGDPHAGSDADDARFWPIKALPDLAFDHAVIIGDAVERARSKLEYTTFATEFLPEVFTMTDLRRVYEVVWGYRLDAPNFHRKVRDTNGFIEIAPPKKQTDRFATEYVAGPAIVLDSPFRRVP